MEPKCNKELTWIVRNITTFVLLSSKLGLMAFGPTVFSLLNLGQASFDVEVRCLFLYGVYKEEGEGAHQLDAPIHHSSSWSSDLSLRTPQRRCDTITFLHSLQASVWSHVTASFLRAPWGSISSLLQMRGGWWVNLAALDSWGVKKEVFKVETSPLTFALYCIVSWSSLYRCWDPRISITYFGRYSPIDVSSEFGGKTELVGWSDWSVWIQIFCISFQRCKDRDVKEFFLYYPC